MLIRIAFRRQALNHVSFVRSTRETRFESGTHTDVGDYSSRRHVWSQMKFSSRTDFRRYDYDPHTDAKHRSAITHSIAASVTPRWAHDGHVSTCASRIRFVTNRLRSVRAHGLQGRLRLDSGADQVKIFPTRPIFDN